MDEKIETVTGLEAVGATDAEKDSPTQRRTIDRLPGWETGRRSMPRKKVSTTVYIEPEQAELLKLLHDRTKVPVAVYIREGIELVLQKYQNMLPGQLPLDVKRPQG